MLTGKGLHVDQALDAHPGMGVFYLSLFTLPGSSGGGMGDCLIYRANSRIHHHQLATLPPHPPSTLADPVFSDHPCLSPLCYSQGTDCPGSSPLLC